MATLAPFQRLLVGVAEDARSDPAVGVGLDLAERWGSELELLHATGTRESGWATLDRLRKGTGVAETLTNANQVVGRHLTEAFPGRTFDGRALPRILRVLPGQPAGRLLERSQRGTSPLVVLGPHRRRGFIDFGSTVRAILATSEVPVWVQRQPPAAIERIAVAVDGSSASRGLLKLASALAASFEARVDVLHVFSVPTFAYGVEDPMTPHGPTYVVDDLKREARREFDQLVNSQTWSVPCESHFLIGEPIDEILARQNETDLFILGTHGRTRLAAAVLGSVAYGVLGGSAKPVLVVPTPSDEWVLPNPNT